MDAKMQEKWEQDVWKQLRTVEVNSFRNNNFEFEEEWLVNPIKKKITKNPDINGIISGGASRIMPYVKFLTDFKAALEKTGVPTSDYSLEFEKDQPTKGSSGKFEIVDGKLRIKYERYPSDVYIFKYGGQEVWFIGCAGYFNDFFFPNLDVSFVCKGLNVKALMDFMKDGLEELLQEYNYKRDYYIDFCRHFLDADYATKYKAIAEGLFLNSPTYLLEVLRLPIEIEAIKVNIGLERLEEFDNEVEISPYSVEKSFIIPFRTYMEKLISPDDHLEIIPDPDDFQGVKVRLNQNTAYIRSEKHSFEPSVHFEPEHMCFESGFNDRLLRLDYLVSYVYVGLKKCDEFLSFYNEYCKICEDLPYHMQMFMALAEGRRESHPLILHGRICGKETFPKWIASKDISSTDYYKDLAKELAIVLQQRGHQAEIEQDDYYSYFNIDGFKLDLDAMRWILFYKVCNIDVLLERMENLLRILNASRYTTTNRWDFPIEEIQHAADNGNADAMICMGAFHTGKYAPWYHQPVDYQKAVEWFEKAITAQDEKSALTIALRNMAFFYSNGLIVEKDTKKAKEYLNLSKRVTYYDEQYHNNHNTLGMNSFFLD